MLLRHSFIIVISIFFILSCRNNDKYTLSTPKYSAHTVILDTSYISIPIDSNSQLFEYKVSSSTDEGIFCGYNHKMQSLDLYDLREQKKISQIKIENADRNNEVFTSCFILNTDSIFLMSLNRIILVGQDGKIKKSIKINSASEDSFFDDNYFIEYDRTKNFSFNKANKKLYITSLNAKGMDRLGSYQKSPVVEMNFSSKVFFNNLPISWSKLYQTDLYGFLTTSYLSLDNNDLIIGYPAEPNIYVYNLISKKLIMYGGYPSYLNPDSLIAKPLKEDYKYNDDKKLLHYFENIRYGKLITNRKSNYIFRTINMALSGEDKELHRFESRKKKLVIYNRKFEIIGSVDLDGYRYVEEAAFLVDKKGLVIPAPRKINELRFKVFNFNII